MRKKKGKTEKHQRNEKEGMKENGKKRTCREGGHSPLLILQFDAGGVTVCIL